MSIYTNEDRFRDLGLKPPDLSFLKKEPKPGERWGKEPLYNPTSLLGNWYEDRRAYMRICPRWTGCSITRTDYGAKRLPTDDTFPPVKYARQIRDMGEGHNFIRNTEDYCDYLQNYTTTYDLMHNWEVRRAGVKGKNWRRWMLNGEANWKPERDNAVSFGNLTQIGFRKGPQVPMMPNDWDIYANNPTSYTHQFLKPYYPDDYVHCRRAASKEIHREMEDLILMKAPDTCGCKVDPISCDPACPCNCICHQIEHVLKHPNKASKPPHIPANTPRFSKLIPFAMMKQKPGMQTVYSPTAPFPYMSLKHPPHNVVDPCKVDCAAWVRKRDDTEFGEPDLCTDYAGDIAQE